LGVVAGAILIYFFQWYILDPAISIFFSLYVLKRVYKLLKQTLDILMEGVPDGIDFDEVREVLETFPGVKRANDIHIWQTDSNSVFLSCCLEIKNISNRRRNTLLCAIQKKLEEKFHITHTTIQMVAIGKRNSSEKDTFECRYCN
jgi:cobalt-zinc-cadmium efflux system protein